MILHLIFLVYETWAVEHTFLLSEIDKMAYVEAPPRILQQEKGCVCQSNNKSTERFNFKPIFMANDNLSKFVRALTLMWNAIM